MKQKLQILSEQFTEDELDWFYSCTFNNNGITLQGECTIEKLRWYKEKGFDFQLDTTNYWFMAKKEINDFVIDITLTIKSF
jgi:hypothetical protein